MSPLCQKAVAAYQRGDWAAAETLCLRVVASESKNPTALHILGLARSRQGRFAEALDFLDAALAAQPDAADILANRGLVLHSLHRPEEALASFNRAHAIAPSPALQLRRGSVLHAMARYEEAAACFEAVLAKDPDNIPALHNRAATLLEMGRLEQALADCDKLLALKPDHAEAWNDRGNILNRMGHPDAALTCFDRALVLKPDLATAHFNRGAVLQAQDRHDEALASYDLVLAITPGSAETLNNRGAALRYLNRLTEAVASFEQAIAADAGNRYALGGLADCLLNLCDWSRREEISAKLQKAVLEGCVVPPFTFLGYCDDAGLQQICARNCIKEISAGPALSAPVWPPREQHGKLRLAYLSADFHEHATSFLMAELFARHDRSRFEVIAISYGPDDGSALRAQLVASFDQFHDVRNKPDESVANLLRTLEVDIAVDLKGHTQRGRPGILRSRPCPVQVNYLGYPGTLGADFIDYIIADADVLPSDMEPFFDEAVFRLEGCYQANPSARSAASTTPSRQACGLPEVGFVFCCFNNNWKISPDLFALWMRLLQAAPGSVLWLLDDNEGAKQNLRAQAARSGVDPARLVFAARMSQEAHLARHRLADLFLDTLPYNAHTTASDALWMGLPVLTCPGRTFPGRVAASLLHAASMPELIAGDLAEYEKLARELACDRKRLHSIRQKLESNRSSAPLFDVGKFRKNLEAAYTMMWGKFRELPKSSGKGAA